MRNRGLPWWSGGYNAGDAGSVPGWGTKIAHAMQCNQ